MTSPTDVTAGVVETAGKVVLELTNVVGLVEKNMTSVSSMRDRFKKKRVHQKLSELLLALTQWRMPNQRVREHFYTLGRYIEGKDGTRVPENDVLKDKKVLEEVRANLKADLVEFGQVILRTKDIVDELAPDW